MIIYIGGAWEEYLYKIIWGVNRLLDLKVI